MTYTEINSHYTALDDLQTKLNRVTETKSLLKTAIESLEGAKSRNYLVKYFQTKYELAQQTHFKAIQNYQSTLGLFIEKVEAAEYIKIEMATQSQLS